MKKQRKREKKAIKDEEILKGKEKKEKVGSKSKPKTKPKPKAKSVRQESIDNPSRRKKPITRNY